MPVTSNAHEVSPIDGSTTMHRADLVNTLVRNVPASCSIHTSKRLLHYTEPTGDSAAYVLHFADGTTAEADVIIGADGINSKTRGAMYQYAHTRDCANADKVKREDCERCKHATPKWTGTVAYRFLIPTEKLREINPVHRALEVKSPMSVSVFSKIRQRSQPVCSSLCSRVVLR